jgi:hypothetical protein
LLAAEVQVDVEFHGATQDLVAGAQDNLLKDG